MGEPNKKRWHANNTDIISVKKVTGLNETREDSHEKREGNNPDMSLEPINWITSKGWIHVQVRTSSTQKYVN